jgi:hypothetical protein
MFNNDGQRLPLMTEEQLTWIGGTNITTDGDGAFYPTPDKAVKWVKLPPELGGARHDIESIETIEKMIDPHIGTPIPTLTFRKWTFVGTDIYMMEDLLTGTCNWCRPQGNLK